MRLVERFIGTLRTGRLACTRARAARRERVRTCHHFFNVNCGHRPGEACRERKQHVKLAFSPKKK